MGATAFVGRCMFAFVFLASAVNKLQTLSDPIAGAATLASIVTREASHGLITLRPVPRWSGRRTR